MVMFLLLFDKITFELPSFLEKIFHDGWLIFFSVIFVTGLYLTASGFNGNLLFLNKRLGRKYRNASPILGLLFFLLGLGGFSYRFPNVPDPVEVAQDCLKNQDGTEVYKLVKKLPAEFSVYWKTETETYHLIILDGCKISPGYSFGFSPTFGDVANGKVAVYDRHQIKGFCTMEGPFEYLK
jgi:hypothetical protein